MSSSTLASVHTPSPSVSFPLFNELIEQPNELIEQPTSLVVNPPLFPMGNHSSHSVDLCLGVFGSVPCDLPREVIRDSLAMSLESRTNASFSGVGVNNYEHSVYDWPLVSVAIQKLKMWKLL